MAILFAYSAVYLAVEIGIHKSLPFEHVALFTFTLLVVSYCLTGLMFRAAVITAVISHLSQFIVVFWVRPHDEVLLLNICLSGAVCGLTGFASYRFERAARKAVFGKAQLQADYQRRLAAERNRIRWLESVNRVLRDELKNAMTGIDMSLQLAGQIAVDPQGIKYLSRANKSLRFMRRILKQVFEATSLETSLAEKEFELIELSQLVAERVRDCADEDAYRSFVGEIEDRIFIRGNADRLVQMLDKLINNAIEHADAAHPIEIIVKGEQRIAILVVRNIGDSLPSDPSRIFEPYVSEKPRGQRGNVGLGLYVARTIAACHGGTIEARSIANASGAEFVVELPRAQPIHRLAEGMS